MATSLPPVTPAGAGSNSFGYPGAKQLKGKSTKGFSQEDSIEIKTEEDNNASLIKNIIKILKQTIKLLISVLKSLLHPIKTVDYIIKKRKDKPISPEKKLLDDLLEKAKNQKNKTSEETPLQALKRQYNTPYPSGYSNSVSANILTAMDTVFYNNFQKNMNLFPESTLEPENMSKNPVPPSILLKNADEEILVRTLVSQTPFTQEKILKQLPRKTLNYLIQTYPQIKPNFSKNLTKS